MTVLKKILINIVIVVGLMVLLLSIFQDAFVFRFKKLDGDFKFKFDQPFEEHTLITPDRESIDVLWFKTHQSPKGLVIYFHGNAGNLERWGQYAVDFTQRGYEVVMMDYRGYGKSSGYPAEQSMYEDADQLFAWIKSKSTPKRLIIYGRSLGSAMASHLAMTAQPDLLILETPFDRLKGAAPGFVLPILRLFPLRSVFPNDEHLKRVTCKTLIFHGTNDRVVPLSSALRLKQVLKDGDEFIILPEGTHRNLRTYEVYKKKLTGLLY